MFEAIIIDPLEIKNYCAVNASTAVNWSTKDPSTCSHDKRGRQYTDANTSPRRSMTYNLYSCLHGSNGEACEEHDKAEAKRIEPGSIGTICGTISATNNLSAVKGSARR